MRSRIKGKIPGAPLEEIQRLLLSGAVDSAQFRQGENQPFFPNLTAVLLWFLGPLYTAKFYAMISIAILGVCGWLCFRMMNLTPVACLVGGLGVLLNTGWFSNSCWGVGTQSINAGMILLAVGLLTDTTSSRRWLRAILAGFAVGMAVMEGVDVALLFAVVCIAPFAAYPAVAGEWAPPTRTERIVALCAVDVAFAAAMIIAFNPFLIYFSALLLSETLFTSILAWAAVLLAWSPKRATTS